MGLFDSLYVTCPKCGTEVEIQIKPPDIPGRMTDWKLETAPQRILERASYLEEQCDCENGGVMIVGSEGNWRLRLFVDVKLDPPES